MRSLVLDEVQMVGFGDDVNAMLFQTTESRDRNVLDFNGHDIQIFSKFENGVFVIQIALHKPVRKMTTGCVSGGVHDFNPHVEIHGRLDHHAAQLTTSKYPNAKCWTQLK